MGILWTLKSKLQTSGFLMVCVMLFLYFLFYTINGERGLLKYFYLKKEIAQAQKIEDQYNRQKTELEGKVRLLSSSSLDLDMLEERARAVLNYVGTDEFVILDNSSDQ